MQLGEIIEYRSILRSLITKNLYGRYKNSFFGVGWHLITPILMLGVYYIAFTELRQNEIEYYWIYIASGIFAFNYMISNLSVSPGILISNSNIIKKMYFPRELIIIAQCISSLIVCIIGYMIVVSLMIVTQHNCLSYSIFLTPIVLLLMFFFVLGYSLFFAAITVYVRDIQYCLNTITIVFFFLTPLYFLADSTSGVLQTIIWMNPFTYYVELFHDIMYFGVIPDSITVVVCLCGSIISLICGTLLFGHLKKGITERL